MKKQNWVWMPHAGHFICGNHCRFHLNTYVGKYIVSTVGELWFDQSARRIHASVFDKKWYAINITKMGDNFDDEYMKRFGYEELGIGRTYETMVFKAKKQKEGLCCPYRPIRFEDLDMEGYNDAELAYKGHLKMCKKWSVL
jgi:hypothetical protein